jgi:hypothetical protein
MDDNQTLAILIKFGLDDAKAQQALAEIGNLQASTKAAAGTMEGFSEAAKGAEKRIEGVSGGSREMYRIFSEMDRIMPGLGEGLRAVFTGPLGIAGLGLVSVLELNKAYQKWQDDAHDRFVKLIQDADDYNNVITKLLANGDTQDEQFTKRTELTAKLDELTDSVNEKLARQIQLINASKEAFDQAIETTDKIRENTEASADAVLKMQEALGNITSMQGELIDINKKANDEMQRVKDEMDKAQKSVFEKLGELNAQQGQLGGLGTSEQVSAAKEAAENNKKVNDAMIHGFADTQKKFNTTMGDLLGNLPGHEGQGILAPIASKLLLPGITAAQIQDIQKQFQTAFRQTNLAYEAGAGGPGERALAAFSSMVQAATQQAEYLQKYNQAKANAPSIDAQTETTTEAYNQFLKLTQQIPRTASKSRTGVRECKKCIYVSTFDNPTAGGSRGDNGTTKNWRINPANRCARITRIDDRHALWTDAAPATTVYNERRAAGSGVPGFAGSNRVHEQSNREHIAPAC